MKLIFTGVYGLIETEYVGRFQAGTLEGPLDLVPFHDFDSHIPIEVKVGLTEIDTGLKDGIIVTSYNPGD
jgi:hypothetical protein